MASGEHRLIQIKVCSVTYQQQPSVRTLTASTRSPALTLLLSMKPQAVLDEHSARSTTPSLLMAAVGQRVLSRLDDGLGCCSPEQVVALWTEEGIRSSREILQVRAVHSPKPCFYRGFES